MPERTARTLLASIVGMALLVTTACSAIAPQPSPTTPAAVIQDPSSATVTVADDPSASARAVATSAALFRSAPGVVVVKGDDKASAARAGDLAARFHVPVLPVDASGSGAVAHEVKRLGASWYLAVGGARLDVDGVVRDSVSSAPPTEKASRASRRTIVVTSDGASDPAATATARAAEARVVTMPSDTTDIQDAPDVIDALHAASSDATLLVGSGFRSLGDPEWAVKAARTGWQLPNGGQRPFDGHRFVALYGTPGAPSLGVLGEQDPAATVRRVEQLVSEYKPLSDKPVVPALEIIATVASGSPGADGDYSTELPAEQLQPYIDAARAAHASVIIDLQPGRSDFLSQAKQYQSLLEQPDVGLALDPEWRLTADQLPLRQIGSVGAQEVDQVSSWLADLVRQHDLPPKMFVLHQFRLSMLQDRASINTSRPELDTLIHVDGQGSQPDKQATWKALHDDAPAGIAWGWKNFYDEDSPMLTPQQTLEQVGPTPDLVTYQ